MKKNLACLSLLVAVGIHYDKPEPTYFEKKNSEDSRILRDTPWTPRGATQELESAAKSRLQKATHEEDADQ